MQNACSNKKVEKGITVGVKASPLDVDIIERFFSFGTTLSRKGETASVVVVVGFFLSMILFS